MNDSTILKNLTLIGGSEVDITIAGNKIKSISKRGISKGEHTINCAGMSVSSGWIDMHVHAFKDHHPYGDEIDKIGVYNGVTTVVDAGSCGTDQMSELIGQGIQQKTNLLTLLNVSRIGLKRMDELSDLSWINEGAIISAVKNYAQDIVGLKVRMSNSVLGDNGLKPLVAALKIADRVNLPIMVHVGSSPPNITDIVKLLRKNDVITHYLNGKENKLFQTNGLPYPEVREAIERGVLLDVGHGTASFSFATAKIAQEANIHFNTISTDIYRDNRRKGPVFSLAHTMSKFLYLGYALEEIIDAVTINPATWLKRPELGKIQTGHQANLTLFKVEDKPTLLMDSEGKTIRAKQIITTKGVVINGEVIIY